MSQLFCHSAFGAVDELYTSWQRCSRLESSALETLLNRLPKEIVGDRYTEFEDQTLTVTSLLFAEVVLWGREGIPG